MPKSPGRSNTRIALATAAAISAAALAACQVTPSSVSQTRPATRPAATAEVQIPDAPPLGVEPVAKGVYIAIDRRQPLTGDALLRAKLTRAQVLAAVAEKVAISTPATQPATQPRSGDADAPDARPRDAEAPPMAVKYYLQGRARFLEGANSEAMDFLEKSLQLDPQGFTVLRLMGRVCFAASQLARGAMYLERAHGIRPNDVEVNYFLGRYWLERSDTDHAIYYLMQAEDSPEKLATSTQTPLASFYLGIALQAAGYHAAAAKEYEHFLELAALPVPGYRYDPELSYLITMLWASHLAAAENYARLGSFGPAVPHYQFAAAARPEDVFIGSRLVNALVHDNKPLLAKKAALALLASTHASDDAIKLLGWSYGVAGTESSLIADLRAYLQAQGASPEKDATAAITLASTQESLGKKAEAFATLQKYLDSRPTDLNVLGRLLKRVDSPGTFRAALISAAAAIAADRALTEDVIKVFLPAAEGPAAAAFLKAEDRDGRRNFAIYFLQAVTRRSQHAAAASVEADFQECLRLAPDFYPASAAYASYLLAAEKFPEATRVIQQTLAQDQKNPKAWQLQIEGEAAQQRYVHALQLAHEARAKFPDDADIRMQLVAVYRLRQQDAEADAELQALIKDAPKYEPAYRALVNSLLLRARRNTIGNNVSATLATTITTLNKLAQEIPNSHFCQVTSALVYARSQRFEEADVLLRALLAEDPDDVDVLVPLAQVRQILGHTADATGLLENALKRKAQPDLVRALAGIYRSQDHPADALNLTRRFREENPDAEIYALIDSSELVTQNRPADAIAVMTDAAKKFPHSENIAQALARLQDQADDREGAIRTLEAFSNANGDTTDRLYTLSHYFSRAGNDDAAVAAMQRVLAIMPDHIGANNDLGYFWVDLGIHLDQAEPMIRKAVENEPNNAAFTDSLGWLYYKQGKFGEAVATLEKAVTLPDGLQPDVIQHLGDALFRNGRGPEAVERWGQARVMLEGVSGLSKSDQKTRDYLTQVINAARNGGQPAVSPFVDPSAPKAAFPDTMPAQPRQ